MDPNEPQRCIKCHKIPQDILMLACSHDLCLDCAAQRLSFELKKKKTANSIVCEICYERTPLDPQSIGELEKLIVPAKQTASKPYAQSSKVNQNQRFERVAAKVAQDERIKEKVYQRQPVKEYGYGGSQVNNNTSSRIVAGISTRKQCNQHPDEDILYFCFDCKCQCICPQCVIHGKHKDHDVKTIKKSHPLIKGQLESHLDKIQSAIENLLIKKSEVEKNIRNLNDHNNQTKSQIQKAFQEVRNSLSIKQKEILSKCDANLHESLQELQKGVKVIIKRIEDLKGFSGGISESMKKQQLFLLNFYAKKWRQMNEEVKDSQIVIAQVAPVNSERTLSSILETTDYIGKIRVLGRENKQYGAK